MMQSLTDLINQFGLAWKPKSLEVLPPRTCEGDQSWDLLQATAAGDQVLKVAHVTSIKALGVSLDALGSTGTSSLHNVHKALRAFWADPCLRSKDLSVAMKFARYVERIQPIAAYNCGSWTWSHTLRVRLEAMETRMLSAMAPVFRRPGEEI